MEGEKGATTGKKFPSHWGSSVIKKEISLREKKKENLGRLGKGLEGPIHVILEKGWINLMSPGGKGGRVLGEGKVKKTYD